MKPEDWMAHRRKRQGLPPTITDPVVLAKLAVLLRSSAPSTAPRTDVAASPPPIEDRERLVALLADDEKALLELTREYVYLSGREFEPSQALLVRRIEKTRASLRLT